MAPDLDFVVESVAPVSPSMVPMLRFTLRVTNKGGGAVDAVNLQTQIQIEAARRTYIPREGEALLDLFGIPARYGRTLKTMLWTHVDTAIPGFTGSTVCSVDVPCTHDVTVTAGKYFFALEGGEVPLTFQFSGTVFYRDEDGDLQVAPISWSKEAGCRLPVALWHDLLAEHYGDGAWLCMRRDVVDRLIRFKGRRGLASYEDAVEALLDEAEVPVP
jgi:hypothetical protein